MAEGTTVGSVAVKVVPNAEGWDRDLDRQLTPQAQRVGEGLGRTIGDAAGRGAGDGIGEGVGKAPVDAPARERGSSAGRSFSDSLKRTLQATLRDLPKVEITAESSQADRAIAEVRQKLEELRDKRIGVDISADEARARLGEIRQALVDLSAEHPSVDVQVDTARARADIDAFQASVDKLSAESASVRVEAETQMAIEALSAVGIEAEAIAGESPTVRVDADVARAEEALAAVGVEADVVAREEPTIKVDADTGEADSALAATAAEGEATAGSLGGIATAAVAFGPAIAASAAVGMGALAALGASATSVMGALGVGALAIKPVMSAMSADEAAKTSSSGSSGAGAAQEQAKAQAIQSANDQIKQSEESLANTRANVADQAQSAAEKVKQAQAGVATAEQNAAESIKQAQQGVSDAERESAQQIQAAQQGVTQARQQAAEAAQQAAEQTAQAEQQLAQEQQTARQAQQDLNTAREQAVEDLKQMAFQSEDAALAQRSAALGVQEAQQNLNKTMSDPKATQLQREQAQLAMDQAKQSLVEQTDRAKELASQNQKAQAAGVNGTQRVISAQKELQQADQRVADGQANVARARQNQARVAEQGAQQIAKAQQALTNAQQAGAERVAKAQERLADARIKGQRDVAKAEQAVADARQAQERQARQGAQQIAQAQQGVIRAQEALQKAQEKTVSSGTAGNAKLAQSLAKLSPAGLSFMHFLEGAKHGLDNLSKVAQQGFLPGLQRGLQAMAPLMGPVTTLVRNLSTTMGGLAEEAGKLLGGPFGKQFVEFLSKNLGPWLTATVHGLEGFGKGFIILWEAFAPVSTKFLQWFAQAGAGFASWMSKMTQSKGFQDFLNEIIKLAPVFGNVLLNVLKIVGKLVVGLAPLGGLMLKGLSGITGFLAKLSPGTLAAIATALGSVFLAFKVGGPILSGITKGFGLIRTLLPALRVGFTALTGPIGLVVVAIAAAAAGVIWLWKNNKTFRDNVLKIWKDIEKGAMWLWKNVFKPAFTQIGGEVKQTWEKTLKPALNGLYTFLRNDVGPAVMWLYNKIVKPYFQFIGQYIKFMWEKFISPALKALFWFINNVLGPVIGWLWKNVVKPNMEAIGSAIKFVWEHVISPAFNAFHNFMKNTLGPAISWLWNNVVKPCFSSLGNHIKWVWEHLVSPAFNALSGALGSDDNHGLRGVFKKAVTAISNIWSDLRKDIGKPINAVIKVIDDYFIDGFNKIGKNFNVTIDKIPTIPGLASGGVVPGPYMHDRADNVLGLSDAGVPVARVNPGEFITNNQATRSMEARHPGALDYINRTGRLPGYADGGLVSEMFDHLRGYWPGGNILNDVEHAASSAWHAVTHPVSTAKSVASSVVHGAEHLAKDASQAVTGTLSGDALKLARIVKFAMEQVHKKYVWGAAGPDAFDCSGLTHASYLSGANINIPHLADSQAHMGRSVGRGSIQPGDLLFPLPGHPVPHVGIAVTPDLMVEAASPKLGVIGPHAIPASLPNGARRILGDVNATEVAGIVKGLGAIQAVEDAAGSVMSVLFDPLRGILDAPINALMKRFPNNAIVKIGGGEAKQLLNDAISWGDGETSSSGGDSSGDSGTYKGGGDFEKWWADALKVAGPSYAQYKNAVGTVAEHESAMNPNAVNHWDSNAKAGHPSAGLMQFIPSTFAEYEWPGHTSFMNPVDQILAYFKYSTARYGSPNSVPGLVSIAHGGGYRGYGTGTLGAAPGISLLGDSPHSVADDAIELVFGRQFRNLKGHEQVYNERQLGAMAKSRREQEKQVQAIAQNGMTAENMAEAFRSAFSPVSDDTLFERTNKVATYRRARGGQVTFS